MPNKFDRIIQENFREPTVSLLKKFMNMEISESVVLPRKMQRTLEREVDMIFNAVMPGREDHIVNIEWQSSNDKEMCYRMLLYDLLIRDHYKKPVIGIVIYIGEEKMSMATELVAENLYYKFSLIDLTAMDPDVFLNSDIPEEIILSVLAGKTRHEEKRPLVREILSKLRKLLEHDERELGRRIAQFEILGELRNIQQIISEEEKKMAITYNIENDIRYNQGLEKGLEKGMQERNIAFVTYLIQHTDHSDEKIAALADVSLQFVADIRKSISK